MSNKEIIISTENCLGGSPRLEGRRLSVGDVIFGITDYDNGNILTYQKEFEVTDEEIKHSILYCMEQKCESKPVPQSCQGCIKKFKKDLELDPKEFEDCFIEENWKIARLQFDRLKTELNIPESYELLIQEK